MNGNITGIWIAIVIIGAFTFATRLSFILLLGQREIPPLLGRALRLVPPAVLSAIIFPEVLRPGGRLDLSPGNPRLLAGLLAAVVAWRTKNIFLTIGAGMAALLLLQALVK
jgi:branched-subunit amino acid transport protein